MFNNTHFLEVNEELIRIFNLLANFAELNQLNDYTFDVKTHTFTLNKVEKNYKLSKSFLTLSELRFDLLNKTILLLNFSIFVFVLVGLWQAQNSISQGYRVITGHIFVSLFMILVIVFIWAFISKVKHNIQQESKKEIKKAIDNIVIKQPIVKEILRIAQTNTNVLKLASLIIKKIIKQAEARQKKILVILPLLSTFVAGLYIIFVIPNQLLKDNLDATRLPVLIALSTLAISPLVNYLEQSRTQSLIMKLQECLLIVEEAQIMLDEEHIYKKQVQGEKIKSTKLHPQFGSARDLLKTSDDFNTPIADFDENS